MTSVDEASFPFYEVRLTEPAEIEVDAAVLHLARFSPESATRWHEGLVVALQSLSQIPRRCPLAPENALLNNEIRQLIYKNGKSVHRILFTIFEREEDEPAFVRIARVLHGARQQLGEGE